MKHRSLYFAFIISLFLVVSGCASKTPLIKASASGNTATIQKLINEGANINEPDGRGYTPLMHAVWSGKIETVKVLINKGADINAKDSYGYTPLLWAIYYGYVDIANLLIDRGADINAKDKEGDDALLNAVKHGNVEIVKSLINKGAALDTKDSSGMTPLVYAASTLSSTLIFTKSSALVYSNTIAVIKQLIKGGADVNARGPEGRIVLDLVLCSFDIDIINDLIKAGANLWMPEAGKARIFIIGIDVRRLYTTVGIGGKNKKLNLTKNTGLAFFDVDPGKHTVYTVYATDYPYVIEVMAGQAYYLLVTQNKDRESVIHLGEYVSNGILVPRTNIQGPTIYTSRMYPLAETEAKKVIKELLKSKEVK